MTGHPYLCAHNHSAFDYTPTANVSWCGRRGVMDGAASPILYSHLLRLTSRKGIEMAGHDLGGCITLLSFLEYQSR